MQVRYLVLCWLLLIALPANAQLRELLRSIDQRQAQRLEAYNRVFLQEELYSAGRYRIVAVNTDLLLQNEPVAITPFPDVKPILLTPEKVRRTDVAVSWLANVLLDDPAFQGAQFKAPITVLWWDLNDLGNAELSGSNRFRFSPVWRIDENNQPVLMPDGVTREAGPPPRTPEEIAEHKRLSRLQRRAFGSLATRLELPTGQFYVVAPLRHTPRYSVVYELDRDKIVPIPFEPEDAVNQTEEQRRKVQQYDAFRRSLQTEDKPVRGDIQ